MKKLTTNQWLLLGGTIGVIYILYSKSKRKGSDMIKDALNGQIPDVSVSDGDKTIFKPEYSIPTGETKYPIKPQKPNRPKKGGTVDLITNSKDCNVLISQWKGIQAKTKWSSQGAMIKARNKFLGNCIRPYPVT
jgi:hypothetical protein|tara:strand:+ start:260 stop:661 length:402 start_codon:yes stop_codon:yes gene_type:complete